MRTEMEKKRHPNEISNDTLESVRDSYGLAQKGDLRNKMRGHYSYGRKHQQKQALPSSRHMALLYN